MASKAGKKGATRLADARARMYHDLIFESAESVFGTKGYDGSTMQDIAEEAGVSLKTLYATFASKQALYDEIMTGRAASFVAATREAMDGAADPLDRLARGVHAYVRFLFEHRSWLQIHLRARMAWSFRPSQGEAARAWQEGHEAYAQLLAEGMEQGTFYPGDPTELAILAQALMQVQLARAAQRGDEDPAEVAEAILVQLRRLLCPGTGSETPAKVARS